MRKLRLVLGLVLASISVGSAIGTTDRFGAISSGKKRIFPSGKKVATPIHKALLTQRGYIQFLRWELPVPEIEEFTFCLWVKSTNLTYPHSIFSYSKHEKERLVRAWISPLGKSVHLEIGNVEILAQPTTIEEHRWYHVCQSWENGRGRYALWIDGHVEADGYVPQMIGHVIPGEGDLVVGQEYTDFDKGLEEGVEGAVLGFNLLLASAFDPSNFVFPDTLEDPSGLLTRDPDIAITSDTDLIELSPTYETDVDRLRRYDEKRAQLIGARVETRIRNRGRIVHANRGADRVVFESEPSIGGGTVEQETRVNFFGGSKSPTGGIFVVSTPETTSREGDVVFDANYAPAKGVLGPEVVNASSFFGKRAGHGRRRKRSSGLYGRSRRDSSEIVKRGRSQRRKRMGKPLGLQLVETTYEHCEIGRGSPFIGGSLMLISWTRTPVKVFGGAIIKNAKSDCGNF